jgi:glycosyltransferase involved in cell wall biosynthesis
MKILVYTSLFPNHLNPDFGIFIKNRMFNFAKLDNCQIVVVAPVPYCPPWKRLGRWYEFSKIKKKEVMQGIIIYHPRYLLVPKISMLVHGLSMFLSSIGTIKKIKKEFSFDLIDAHYVYPDGFAGLLLGRYFNKPLVVTARGSDIHQFSQMRFIKPFIKKTLKQSQHNISVCNALGKIMIDLGSPVERIDVIPNGVDIDRFFPVDKKAARKYLSISPTTKVIFSVGSLIPLKGHHLTIEALKEIIKQIPEAHLYIAGKGDYLKALENKISELRLEKFITLLGHVRHTELINWYSAADVFCLASSREGWANVIMESMACGTPVVATNVWGAPEIITDPDVGILVERNPEAISKALIHALKEIGIEKKFLIQSIKDP